VQLIITFLSGQNRNLNKPNSSILKIEIVKNYPNWLHCQSSQQLIFCLAKKETKISQILLFLLKKKWPKIIKSGYSASLAINYFFLSKIETKIS